MKKISSQSYQSSKGESGAGFTVLEVVVVITIVVIFVAIVISNFSKIRLQFSLSRVSYQLNQNLNRARNMASSALIYKDSSEIERAVDGYGVYFDLNSLGNKKYIIYADKAPGNKQYDALDYIVDTIDFSAKEEGIIIQNIINIIGQNVSINFNSANLNLDIFQLVGTENYIDIILGVESDITNTRVISINTSNLIEIK